MISAKRLSFFLIIFAALFLSGCSPQDTTPPQPIVISITISAKTLFNHESDAIEKWSNEKFSELKDSNGIMLTQKNIKTMSDKNASDVLEECLKENAMTYIFEKSGLMGIYIKSINGLGERTISSQSGWYYYVNDISPSYSISKYKLRDGDHLRLEYTCESGDLTK